MSLKLIKEDVAPQDVALLEESVDGKKNLYVTGPFLQQEVVNRNGRLYPAAIMEKEARRYINEKVDQRSAWGELNHPPVPTIDPNNVSHRIVSLVQEGNNWIGKALILNNPKGQIVRSLLEGDGRIGVSSRALGSLKENTRGYNEVQSDFRLMTAADIVLDPSAPDAFVSGIMEGKEFIWDNGIIKEADIAAIHETIVNAPRIDNDKVMIEAFRNFISKIGKL